MSSPFQSAFMAKTPLHNHGEIKKVLKKAKNENEQDYSMERVSKLEEQLVEAKKAHKEKRKDKKQDVSVGETGFSDVQGQQ